MKFENWNTYNWEFALRGMRNPKNSWDKSDSAYNTEIVWNEENKLKYNCPHWYDYCIGPNDMNLAKSLVKAGNEHRKFLRQIFVTIDITAPLYWWKEMDTYKIGTTTNSTSTMHKLADKPITLDCFETDDYVPCLYTNKDAELVVADFVDPLVSMLEYFRKIYVETKDPKYWKELIRWLPESYLQTRTWTGNYEVLRNIYRQRWNHKLTEWHTFCDFIRVEFPYAKELIIN